MGRVTWLTPPAWTGAFVTAAQDPTGSAGARWSEKPVAFVGQLSSTLPPAACIWSCGIGIVGPKLAYWNWAGVVEIGVEAIPSMTPSGRARSVMLVPNCTQLNPSRLSYALNCWPARLSRTHALGKAKFGFRVGRESIGVVAFSVGRSVTTQNRL